MPRRNWIMEHPRASALLLGSLLIMSPFLVEEAKRAIKFGQELYIQRQFDKSFVDIINWNYFNETENHHARDE